MYDGGLEGLSCFLSGVMKGDEERARGQGWTGFLCEHAAVSSSCLGEEDAQRSPGAGIYHAVLDEREY
jgi:hypothetical protein